VAGLKAQSLMIGFGGEGTQMLDTDFTESGLAALMPEARLEQFDPAFHFTAMPVCKPAGEAILQAEQDDPVCTDPDGTDRAAVHQAIIDLIAEELGL
jgi:predicted dienelactone hydrolase